MDNAVAGIVPRAFPNAEPVPMHIKVSRPPGGKHRVERELQSLTGILFCGLYRNWTSAEDTGRSC